MPQHFSEGMDFGIVNLAALSSASGRPVASALPHPTLGAGNREMRPSPAPLGVVRHTVTGLAIAAGLPEAPTAARAPLGAISVDDASRSHRPPLGPAPAPAALQQQRAPAAATTSLALPSAGLADADVPRGRALAVAAPTAAAAVPTPAVRPNARVEIWTDDAAVESSAAAPAAPPREAAAVVPRAPLAPVAAPRDAASAVAAVVSAIGRVAPLAPEAQRRKENLVATTKWQAGTAPVPAPTSDPVRTAPLASGNRVEIWSDDAAADNAPLRTNAGQPSSGIGLVRGNVHTIHEVPRPAAVTVSGAVLQRDSASMRPVAASTSAPATQAGPQETRQHSTVAGPPTDIDDGAISVEERRAAAWLAARPPIASAIARITAAGLAQRAAAAEAAAARQRHAQTAHGLPDAATLRPAAPANANETRRAQQQPGSTSRRMTYSTGEPSPGLLRRYGYNAGSSTGTAKNQQAIVPVATTRTDGARKPATCSAPFFDADISGIVPSGVDGTLPLNVNDEWHGAVPAVSPEPQLVGTETERTSAQHLQAAARETTAAVNDENAASNRDQLLATHRRTAAGDHATNSLQNWDADAPSSPPLRTASRSTRALFRSVARDGRASIAGDESPPLGMQTASGSAVVSGDQTDVTIHTQIAMDDAADLFASPTAVFEKKPSITTGMRKTLAAAPLPVRLEAAPVAHTLQARPQPPPPSLSAVDMSRVPPDARRLSQSIANRRRMSGIGSNNGLSAATYSRHAVPNLLQSAAVPQVPAKLRSPPKSPIVSPLSVQHAIYPDADDRTARLSSINELFNAFGSVEADNAGMIIRKESQPTRPPFTVLSEPTPEYVTVPADEFTYPVAPARRHVGDAFVVYAD